MVLGAHSLAKKEASKQTFRIVRFIPSPGFASKPESNDVMLVKLHTAAKLNSHVQPLQLSPQTDIRAGTKCQVTGWGATNPELLSLSDTLQEVTVTVISRELCNSASYYNHQPIITKGMVCAGDAKGQRDACQVRACPWGARPRAAAGEAAGPRKGGTDGTGHIPRAPLRPGGARDSSHLPV